MVGFGRVRSGEARWGMVRPVWCGRVWSGMVRWGDGLVRPVRLGAVRLGVLRRGVAGVVWYGGMR